MAEPNSGDVGIRVRMMVQRYRDEFGDELFEADARWSRARRAVIHVVGAMAIGVFSSGIAILAIVVLLNFFFHFSPS